PVALAAGSGVLEGLVLEVVPDHFQRALGLEDLGRARRLDHPPRVHGDRGRAAFDALGQRLDEGPLVLLAEERAEVLDELAARRRGSPAPGPSDPERPRGAAALVSRAGNERAPPQGSTRHDDYDARAAGPDLPHGS